MALGRNSSRGFDTFFPGMPIIVTANNRKMNLYNGETAILQEEQGTTSGLVRRQSENSPAYHWKPGSRLDSDHPQEPGLRIQHSYHYPAPRSTTSALPGDTLHRIYPSQKTYNPFFRIRKP